MRIVEIAVVLRVCRRNTATVPAVCGLFELFAQLQINTEALALVRIELSPRKSRNSRFPSTGTATSPVARSSEKLSPCWNKPQFVAALCLT